MTLLYLPLWMSNFSKIMIDVSTPAPGLSGAASGALEAGGGLLDVYHDLVEVGHPKALGNKKSYKF